MDTIYMLGLTDCPDDLLDTFALDEGDLRQIALDNYQMEDGVLHVEVRPPDARNKVRLTVGGYVVAEYYIFSIHRVSR